MPKRRISAIRMPDTPSPVQVVQKLASEQILHPVQKTNEELSHVLNNPASDPEGYQSPITLKLPTEKILHDLDEAKETGIVSVVQQMGIDVDKEELFKALRYDRKQYDIGYRDGLFAGTLSTWHNMIDSTPKDGEKVLLGPIDEDREIYLGVCDLQNGLFHLQSTDRTLSFAQVLEWASIPDRLDIPF